MSEATTQAFNQLEVVLWLVIGLYFAIRCLTSASVRRQSAVAAVAFLLFAGSDAVEVHTGAWWRPWWLLVWKGSCLLTLIGVWWTWPRQEKPDTDGPDTDEPQTDASQTESPAADDTKTEAE